MILMVYRAHYYYLKKQNTNHVSRVFTTQGNVFPWQQNGLKLKTSLTISKYCLLIKM